MSVTAATTESVTAQDASLFDPLEPGDHMDQPTFHARYRAMPPGTRAELIGGVVHMPSPVKIKHGSPHLKLATWLGNYEAGTPGVQGVDNGTAILGNDSEPQPDASLRILSGGQTSESEEGYILGCPELVSEIAFSSQSYDLHEKLADYQKYGAKEYVVFLVKAATVRWFRRDDNGRFVETPPGADGIYRSTVFPGLWLDAAALLSGNARQVLNVLNAGLATPEHAEFAAELASRTPVE